MSITIHHALTLAADFLPVDLMNGPLKKGLSNVTPIFSDCCSSYYLEWHLADPVQSDLLCSVVHRNGSRLLKRINDRSLVAFDSRWKKLASFLAAWDGINAELDGQVPHIWIASDFNRTAGRYDPPNIHYCIDKKFLERKDLPNYRNTLSPQLFNRTIKILTQQCCDDEKSASAVAAVMRRCFRALGSEGEVVHLSFMHTRRPPIAKLNVTLPTDKVPELLKTMRWGGDVSGIIKLCREFAPDEKRIKCNITVADNICNRFELELEYNTPLDSDARRKRMVGSLCDRGILNDSTARQLMQWPGRTKVASRQRNGTPIPFERWLDVKLCINEHGGLYAKVYLGFALLPAIDW